MSFEEFHNQFAHLGGLADCPGCLVCLQSKKSLGRVYKRETPARDSRTGYVNERSLLYRLNLVGVAGGG